MILQAVEIARRLERITGDPNDPLVVAPLTRLEDLKTSGEASINLRLGTWFVTPRAIRTEVFDIAHADGDQTATTEKTPEGRITKQSYVRFGGRFILHPGAFVLATTLEWL